MSDRSLAHCDAGHRSAVTMRHKLFSAGTGRFQLPCYLDDDLQGFNLLVGGPGLLQRLVQLLDAVGVILLGEVEQLSLGTLHTHTNTQVGLKLNFVRVQCRSIKLCLFLPF